jgi:organic hydroperoxide reductase OsmC/OhrA
MHRRISGCSEVVDVYHQTGSRLVKQKTHVLFVWPNIKQSFAGNAPAPTFSRASTRANTLGDLTEVFKCLLLLPPSIVPTPYSNPAHVDPEEAYVASISSCHMLTFLHVASRQGFQVDSYEDEAIGVMTKNEKGVPWVSSVTLHPKIVYSGENLPTPADEERLHHLAHEQCFIANSIKSEVTVRGITAA